MLCPSQWSDIGSLGDCPVLFINVVGFLWVTLFNLATYFRVKRLQQSDTSLSAPLIDSSSSPASIHISNGIILVRALQLISIFQVIISGFLLLVDVNGNSYLAYDLNVGLHIAGWLEIFVVNSYLLVILHTGTTLALYGCLGWALLQLVSTGLICVTLVDSIDDNSSLAQFAYFLVSLVAMGVWVFVFFNMERDTSDDRENLFKNTFSFFRNTQHDVKLTNFVDSGDDTESASIRRDWEQNDPYSAPTPSIWATRGGVGNPIITRAVKKSDFVDIRLSFDEKSEESSVISDSFGDRGSRTSKSLDVLRAMDFDGLSISKTSRGPTHPTTGMSTAAVLSAKRSAGALRDQLSYAGDCTISVVDWNFVSINGKVVVVYKLGLGESTPAKQLDAESAPGSRSVRIALKRFDEILYLREKIAADFPYLAVPVVPSVICQDSEQALQTSR